MDDLCLLRVPELSRAEQLLGSEVLWGQGGTELSYSGIFFPTAADDMGREQWRRSLEGSVYRTLPPPKVLSCNTNLRK